MVLLWESFVFVSVPNPFVFGFGGNFDTVDVACILSFWNPRKHYHQGCRKIKRLNYTFGRLSFTKIWFWYPSFLLWQCYPHTSQIDLMKFLVNLMLQGIKCDDVTTLGFVKLKMMWPTQCHLGQNVCHININLIGIGDLNCILETIRTTLFQVTLRGSRSELY